MNSDDKLAEDKQKLLNFFQKNFSWEPTDLKSGVNSITFSHEDKRIKFPITDQAVSDYVKESYLSNYIHQRNPDLPISVIEVKEIDGQKFSVHQEIKGKTLIKRLPEDESNIHFESLSSAQKQALARDLGQFLAGLHNIDTKDIDKNLCPLKQTPDEISSAVAVKRKLMYKELGIKYQKTENNPNDLVLSHNDFHGGNFIVDNNNKFKGVIDFDATGLNQRHKDFMPLYMGYGRGFVREALASYNQYSSQKMSMQELDYQYLNKVAELYEYAVQSDNMQQSAKLKQSFSKQIDDYKKDKELEMSLPQNTASPTVKKNFENSQSNLKIIPPFCR